MTEDYLLQEFHEAGIWLSREREQLRRAAEMQQLQRKMFAQQIQALQNHPRLVVDHARLAQLPPPFPGQMIPMRRPSVIGRLVSGIFGAL